jgi:cyclic pyranopterin phosphate synthase
MNDQFTHFNEDGRARMVDVSSKDNTERVATAEGSVYMKAETLKLIQDGKIKKGDVLAVAQVAGISGAKKTWDLIPMCHPLLITSVNIKFKENEQPTPETGLCSIGVQASVKVSGQTGVEMEAITAVTLAALTIYDMCKAVDRGMYFNNIGLVYKEGGKSGVFSKKSVAS